MITPIKYHNRTRTSEEKKLAKEMAKIKLEEHIVKEMRWIGDQKEQ